MELVWHFHRILWDLSGQTRTQRTQKSNSHLIQIILIEAWDQVYNYCFIRNCKYFIYLCYCISILFWLDCSGTRTEKVFGLIAVTCDHHPLRKQFYWYFIKIENWKKVRNQIPCHDYSVVICFSVPEACRFD